MSKPAPPREGITLVVPVLNAAGVLEKWLPQWADALARLGREYDIVAVNDGSTDATQEVLEKLAAGRVRNLTVLKHESPKGFGACLRTALPHVKQPLLFYTSTDYPYSPQDLPKLLERISLRDALFNKQPDLISGCRTGLAAPPLVALLGKAWRLLCRGVLGLHLETSPSWLGVRGTLYRWRVNFLFGAAMKDVNSRFKLFRTAFLCRFPIQSDTEFVHTELVAKATFLTSIMDEVPLTPAAAELPTYSNGADFRSVFANPDFGNPTTPTSGASTPAVSASPTIPDSPPPENPPVTLAMA